MCEKVSAAVVIHCGAFSLLPLKAARWANPAEMKKALPSASIVGKSRTVFNIGGNKYRVIADVFYDRGRVLIRAILTHEEYDEVDVEKL